MSEVVNFWDGECLGWWTSDFTLGVVNVWGGERLGGERLTIVMVLVLALVLDENLPSVWNIVEMYIQHLQKFG